MIGILLVSFLVTPAVGELRDAQQSHIDENVPAPPDFDKFLRRDLAAYFAQERKRKDLPLELELLRDGPTQSGVAYPKFYVWVRIAGGKTPADRGAVRVAAIEKKRFEVTDFLSEQNIGTEPDRIYRDARSEGERRCLDWADMLPTLSLRG
jgi:hypothetical protein